MNKTIASDPSEEHVERVLRSFFQAEMPDPWPISRVTKSDAASVSPPFWWRSFGKLALVASVLLILFSYFMLAAMFPAQPEPGLSLNRQQTIGSRLGIQRVLIPKGGEALLWEETIPGERPTIIISVQEIKRP